MTHQAALIEILRIVRTIPGEALGSRAQAIWQVTVELKDQNVTFDGVPAYEARQVGPFDQLRAIVQEWLDAYPTSMFPVPPKASTLTREQWVVRSNDSAAMGRHMATRLLQQIDELQANGGAA